jgi:hypothetical protein
LSIPWGFLRIFVEAAIATLVSSCNPVMFYFQEASLAGVSCFLTEYFWRFPTGAILPLCTLARERGRVNLLVRTTVCVTNPDRNILKSTSPSADPFCAHRPLLLRHLASLPMEHRPLQCGWGWRFTPVRGRASVLLPPKPGE